MIVTFLRCNTSRSTNGSNVNCKARKVSFRIAGVLKLTKLRIVTLQSSYPQQTPMPRSRFEPAEHIVIYTDDLLDGTRLVVPRHCRPPCEPTAARYVKSLSKIACDFANFLRTDPRSRNS